MESLQGTPTFGLREPWRKLIQSWLRYQMGRCIRLNGSIYETSQYRLTALVNNLDVELSY